MHKSRWQRHVALLLATVAVPSVAFSQDVIPSGGSFIRGSGSVEGTASGLLINQTSATGIIEWGSFSIGSGAAVHFDNGSGATLNRVTGNLGSRIDGSLTATGSLYLVNGAGIVVGESGMISTGGSFFASTHDVANEDFLDRGPMTFAGRSTASVVNLGTISSKAGDVALIARAVENKGSISAENGTVGLVAGYEILAKDKADENGLFAVVVGGSDTQATNSGAIAAANSELRANGGNVYALAGNTGGVVKATGVTSEGGRIFLTAGEGGKVQVTGKLKATRPQTAIASLPTRVPVPQARPDSGGDIRISGGSVTINGTVEATGTTGSGGTVVVTGDKIKLGSAAAVDASGATGGTVLIGGDYQGGKDAATKYLAETVATADTVAIAKGAAIRADGTQGAGGNVVVWSDNKTTFAGTISATGAGSASGGDAEVSGKAVLVYDGAADLRSESGAFGNLLLDPYNLTISSAASSGMSGFDASAADSVLNVTTLTNALALANVTVTTGSSGSQAGNITVATPITWSANTILTLSAAGSVLINKDITATGANAGLVLTYGTGYSLNNGARVTLSGSAASLSIGGNAYTLIHDVAGLQAMVDGTNYALGNDIDASATASWNAGAGFIPIASFANTLSGLGHTVDGLTINRPGQTITGLIGALWGTVRDLTLSNASVSGSGRVGAVVGNVLAGSLINVHATGSVTGAAGQIGGLVGWLDQGSISGSSSAVTVSGGDEVGGLVGRLRAGSISDSYATGSVTATGDYAGGLAGGIYQGGTVTNVYASGRVTGPSNTGGLIGGETLAGPVTVSNAYWDVNSTGQSTSFAGTGISNASAYTQATYAGFDFTNTWVMIAGQTRPILRNEYSTVVTTPAALQLMSLDLSASYTLGADIDLTDAFTAVGGYYSGLWRASGFVPIGDNSFLFTGSFDGQGHTISGLTINRAGTNYVGLFGYTNGATIGNVTLSGGSIIGNDDVGALIGYMVGGSVSAASASATISGVSTGEANSGGLIGAVNGGAVSGSSASGNVTGAGYQVGGLVGYLLNGGTITRSYATGNVTGTSTSAGNGYIGGLVGANGYSLDGGTISQSYATGTVTGSSGPIGGFVGHNEGTITDSYATGRVVGLGSASNIGGFVGVNYVNGTITNAYSTGYVTGGAQVGGFAGYNNNSASAITNAYWNTQTSGQSVGISGGPGSATARTTAQLQGSLPAGFSSSIWGTGANLYPYFKWQYAATPVAVSGTAYSDAGTTALAGANVTAVSAGSGMGSAVTGANGYYYIMLAPGSSLASTGVLTYLDNGSTKGSAFSDIAGANGAQNVAIYGTAAHLITGQTALTATQANYLATFGSYADTDLGFLSPSSFASLTTSGGYGVYLNASGNYSLDADLGSAGLLSIDSGGSFGVSGTVELSAGGDLDIADAISWSDASSLRLTTVASSDITLGGAVSAANGTLVISAAGTATTSSAIDVGLFSLTAGTWRQVAGTLASFNATDFRLGTGTTFLRATGGDGTSATPYQIVDVFGLQGLASASLLTEDFVLVADIDASGSSSWNSGAGFASIGEATTSFTGSLDGDGHTISGLVVNRPTTDAGLFGVIGSGGAVSDLAVAGSVRGLNAGLVAGVSAGAISNVATSGSVGNTGSIAAGSLGGIAGINDGTITNVASSATVGSADDSIAGGVAGTNSGTISASYATGSVSVGDDGRAGGLVGYNSTGNISNAFATGAVTAGAGVAGTAGGLVGVNSAAIINTYATGNISGGSTSGGLVGVNSGTVANSYAAGTVPSSAAPYGGLIGNNAGTVTASFWNTATSGTDLGVGVGSASGITGLAMVQMSSLSTFTGAGWDIDDAGGTGAAWRIYDGFTMPLLRSFMSNLTVTGGNSSKTYDGSASSSSVGTVVYNPSGYDTSLVFGTASYTASSANAGTYSGAGLTLSGLYSSQFGYDMTFTPGTLVIGRAALTVTANNANKTYDGVAYLGGNGVTYSGFVGGDTAASLGGTLAYGGTSQAATNVGSYSITASGLTSGNYAITYLPGTLTVSPAALTVTANAQTIAYGNSVPVLTYSITAGSLFGGDTLTGALTTAASSTSNVGTYGIAQGSLAASSNYDLTFVGGDLTIARRSITVTADDLTRVYGEANPPFTYTIGGMGLVGSDTLSGELATLATSSSNVGTYGIAQGTLAASSNYDLTFVGGDLTIGRRSITVTADDLSRVYGEANLPFTYTIGGMGLAGSDTLSGELATLATSSSNVGTYGIAQGTLAASTNYDLTFVGGDLTIGRRSITVTADDLSRVYGEANPPFTYTIGGMGLVGTDTLSGALATLATSSSDVGIYGITQGTLSADGNYSLSFFEGTLTITAASAPPMPPLPPRPAFEPSQPLGLGGQPSSGINDPSMCPAGMVMGGACVSLPHPANLPIGPFLTVGALR
ncbi:MBG domain-containing protein [Neorhizobium sp. Rsf11]|uniref:MBG domain-containing protein n=1 Tax=Neorhizobium phenanthreniclasticum TaxID=3157917 RepID=A0ABV0M5Y5_9HYPH